MKKIAINHKCGSFFLSEKAMRMILDAKGIKYTVQPDEFDDEEMRFVSEEDVAIYNQKINKGDMLHDWFFRRDDADLITAVERLGADASKNGGIVIIEIPDDVAWKIEEADDGSEWVAEIHRTWHYRGE